MTIGVRGGLCLPLDEALFEPRTLALEAGDVVDKVLHEFEVIC